MVYMEVKIHKNIRKNSKKAYKKPDFVKKITNLTFYVDKTGKMLYNR